MVLGRTDAGFFASFASARVRTKGVLSKENGRSEEVGTARAVGWLEWE